MSVEGAVEGRNVGWPGAGRVGKGGRKVNGARRAAGDGEPVGMHPYPPPVRDSPPAAHLEPSRPDPTLTPLSPFPTPLHHSVAPFSLPLTHTPSSSLSALPLSPQIVPLSNSHVL